MQKRALFKTPNWNSILVSNSISYPLAKLFNLPDRFPFFSPSIWQHLNHKFLFSRQNVVVYVGVSGILMESHSLQCLLLCPPFIRLILWVLIQSSTEMSLKAQTLYFLIMFRRVVQVHLANESRLL